MKSIFIIVRYSEWICLVWEWLKRLHLDADESVSSMSCALSGRSIRKRDSLLTSNTRWPIVRRHFVPWFSKESDVNCEQSAVSMHFKDWISRICSEASFQDFKSFASREILLVHWTFSIIARSERFCSRCCAFWWSRVDRLNWKRRARTLCIKIIVSDWNSEKYI